MRAEIVSVGTEMLLGMIADTNAQFLAQQLADLGIDVFWVSQVGDNLAGWRMSSREAFLGATSSSSLEDLGRPKTT